MKPHPLITAKDIPCHTGRDDFTDPVSVGPYSVRVQVERDPHMGEPWKEHDGHGPVSEWTAREKTPGERVLASDRQRRVYYDFAEACKIARRDGWGFNGQYVYEDGKRPRMTEAARKMSPKARAARAAEEDYERLRRWCNDDWYWVQVGVEVSYRGTEIEMDWCGGIESDGDYWREHAADHADYVIRQHIEQRRQQWRAALIEARERLYWRNRGVITKGN